MRSLHACDSVPSLSRPVRAAIEREAVEEIETSSPTTADMHKTHVCATPMNLWGQIPTTRQLGLRVFEQLRKAEFYFH
jgi:hypothetical protein